MERNSRAWALAGLIALLILLMLPNFLWLVMGGGIVALVSGLLVSAILLTTLFAVFNKSIWIACLLLAPLALLAPFEIFYIALYHHPSSEEVIASVFATNAQETFEFFGRAFSALMLSVVACTILALVSAWTAKRAALQWRNQSRTLFLFAVCVLPIALASSAFLRAQVTVHERLSSSLATFSRLDETIVQSFPFGALIRLANYYNDWKEMQTHVSALNSFRFGASPKTAQVQRQIYVLVVGESSRRDRWQLFGYARPTNPELSTTQTSSCCRTWSPLGPFRSWRFH
jgi:glucan phosphoethanolaminetransferase (alkaline phosphatase superfamily)